MVTIRGLRKVYNDVVAVNSLDLDLDPGDIFGFIGPNGAGKSTTIKMLATLTVPSAGVATIGGYDVVKQPEKVRAIIGYMPDSFGVYDNLKVWEYLDFFACAFRIPRPKRPQVIADVLALTDLTIKRDAFVESLSRGMKQRLCLARTLVHDPQVLLLDEPASGLDPRARIEIKELLRELQSMGKTIIISSHILPELAEFCNKVGIIEKGELIVSGDVSEIVRRLNRALVLEVRVKDDVASEAPLGMVHTLAAAAMEVSERQPRSEAIRTAISVLQSHDSVDNVTEAEGLITVHYVGSPGSEWELLSHLVQRGVKVLAFSPQSTDLEDIFMHVTKGIVS